MNEPFIHPTADVQTDRIGSETRIWQYCVVLKGATIGNRCSICFNVFIENDVTVGNDVTVKSGVQLWDGVVLEDNVCVGPNTTFTNDYMPRSKQPYTLMHTRVKQGASLGANCTIVGGVTIGEWAMIGAGSVVTKDVPPHTMWYGNPARPHGYVCTCGHRLEPENTHPKASKQAKDLVCPTCGKRYHLENETLTPETNEPK